MPYSPNCTVVWPRESPARQPRCCLRCLTRLGDSISGRLPADVRPRRHRHRRRGRGLSARPGRPPPPPPPPPAPGSTRTAGAAGAARSAAATAGPARSAAAAAAASAASVPATAPAAAVAAILRPLLRGVHLGEVGARVALRHDLALVDPALHADAPERRARLVKAVVDVGAQRVQRDAAVGVALGACHLGAAQAPRDLPLAALRARSHGARERALHRAAERDAVLQLLGDRLRDELGVELGALDLEDVDLDLLARHPVEVLAEGVDLAAGL